MRGIASYKNVAMESSDQRKLVVMCFEALIRRQMSAKELLIQGKYLEANKDLRTSREIYCELLIALESDEAEELGTNLAQLYDYCIRELTGCGADHNPARIDGPLRVTRILYEGFKEAFEETSK